VLTTAPLVTPAKAQGVKMAQVDVRTGRHLDDRDDRDDRDRRRYNSDTTVGVGPGGVTVGPRQRCRMETTTIERDDGRRITRRERRCWQHPGCWKLQDDIDQDRTASGLWPFRIDFAAFE
jgi:hypothetical protein